MSQKPKFPKTAIRRSKPGKQVNFLTVRANCDFEQTTSEKKHPPRCYPLVSRRLGLAYQYAEARWGDGVAVGVRPGCRSGWLLMGVKVAGGVGGGVAVGVRPDVVRVWLLMEWSCSDLGEGVPISPTWSGRRVFVCCESYTLLIYTYNTKTNYFDIKIKFSLFLFGGIKIYMYLCSRNNNKTN